jgi:hypothetical protein
MKRTHLAIVAALTGLTLFTFAGRAVFAADESSLPPDSEPCYYRGTFCSYPGENYWSGCDSSFEPGLQPTSWAKQYCSEYHSS